MKNLLLFSIFTFVGFYALAAGYRCDLLMSSNRTSFAYDQRLSFAEKVELVKSQWDPKISSLKEESAGQILRMQEALTFFSMVRIGGLNFLSEEHLSVPTTQALVKAFTEKNMNIELHVLPFIRTRIAHMKTTFFLSTEWSTELINQLATIYLHLPLITPRFFLSDITAVNWIRMNVSAAAPLSALQATRLFAATKLAKWKLFSIPERFERIRIQYLSTEGLQTADILRHSTEEVVVMMELVAAAEQIRGYKTPDAVIWIQNNVLNHLGKSLKDEEANSLFLIATQAGWSIESLPGIFRRTIALYGNTTDFAFENPTQEALIVLSLLASQKKPAP